MALICNRHPFEYAENVCSSCGIAFCHDCLVYPRGPKKPPLCVPCAIAAGGVRSSARNQSNLSRREVKKRVRDAKGLQQPQPYVEAPVAASPDRDFELTSNATFDQGWAVSWDEGRDPHPGYPEPVHVSWGNDPFAEGAAAGGRAAASPPVASPPVAAPEPPIAAPTPAPMAAPIDTPAPEPSRPAARPPELPRLQPVVAERAPERPAGKLEPPANPSELAKGHAPVRPGGLPSVRPPLKPGGAEPTRPSLPPLARNPGSAPMPTQQPRVFGGAPATRPETTEPTPPPPAPSGRLRRKDPEGEGAEMLGWLDDLLSTEKDKSDRA